MTQKTFILLSISALLILTGGCMRESNHDKKQEKLSDIDLIEDSIYQAAKIMSTTAPDSSISILHKLLAQTEDSTTYYSASGLILDIQAAVGQWDSIDYWKSRALRYCTTPPITDAKEWILSKAYNSMGVYHSQLRQGDSSIYYLEKALVLAPTVNHLRAKVNIYINMADTYFTRNG